MKFDERVSSTAAEIFVTIRIHSYMFILTPNLVMILMNAERRMFESVNCLLGTNHYLNQSWHIVNWTPWWRDQMETFSALLANCAGNSPVPVNSPHKGQWRRALIFSLICAWIKGWVNNRGAGDLRRNRAHYDVNIMFRTNFSGIWIKIQQRSWKKMHLKMSSANGRNLAAMSWSNKKRIPVLKT